MKRSSLSTQALMVTALFMMLAPRLARGDGGIVQLHETRGPFSVTVFASPEAAPGGLTDVTVLVQWQKNGEVVLDADVSLSLDPPDGVTMSQSNLFCGQSSSAAAFQLPEMEQHLVNVRATREQASNRLLYAAPLELNAAGNWRLHIVVSRESESAGFDCLLPVSRASAKSSGLWPYLAFPPIAIAAFAMNQKLRRHSLEKGP